MKRIEATTATMPVGLPLKLSFAVAALVLALLAIPHLGHAQGIVRGAQEGSREGNRIVSTAIGESVIPGRTSARTRNLEIPGLVLRTIPE